ncbi:MAG: hypothetical protein HQ521_00595, partial [Bacteroidetes bacterium]|nr:hypothetical protein [Bacteroidota bacterium]
NYTGSVLPFICCAKQGIPVIFFSTRGKLEAILSGKASEQIKLVNWLEYCEFDLEYQKTYNYWLENQIRHLCSTSGISGNSPENMIDSLYYLSSKYISTKFNKIARNELSAWLEGMAKVEITLIAADHGLSPESQLSNKVQVDLLPVLLAFLTTLFAGWSKNNKAKTINPEIMSSFYNEIYDRFEYEVIRMLQQLKSRFESLNS